MSPAVRGLVAEARGRHETDAGFREVKLFTLRCTLSLLKGLYVDQSRGSLPKAAYQPTLAGR
jgi:hypothetical protein